MNVRTRQVVFIVGAVTLIASAAACGSADRQTNKATPLVVSSLVVVQSIPNGAIVVSPEKMASISYFTGINAADRDSLRRAMCPATYSDEAITSWVEFLRSDNVVGRLADGRPAAGNVHYPLVDGKEVAVTLTLEPLPDGEQCISAVAVDANFRRLFVPPPF